MHFFNITTIKWQQLHAGSTSMQMQVNGMIVASLDYSYLSRNLFMFNISTNEML